MRVGLNDASLVEWQENDLEHLRYEYDLTPNDLVIDIGAYRGEWANKIYNLYGCQLIVIEPTVSILGFPDGEVINKAASTHNGKETFGGAYYYTSRHELGSTEYECFDINQLLKKHPEIALVKINIEGAEYDLLNHIIDAGLHTRIRNLQVQFHQIEGEPYEELYGAITSKLRQTHRRTWCYPFVWENWQRA